VERVLAESGGRQELPEGCTNRELAKRDMEKPDWYEDTNHTG
jgi:hypothetical protein